MNSMIDYDSLVKHLNYRLKFYQFIINQRIIPGQMDSIELQQTTGKIEELQHILHYIGATPKGWVNK